MEQNQVQGAAREMSGKLEEGVGRVTGDTKAQVEGKFDQAAGKLQSDYGAAMQDLQDFAERLRSRAREQPITALLAAAAIGYLIGRIGRWL